MHEATRHNESEYKIEEVPKPEKKYTVDSAGYRQYEMTCAECDNGFTRFIPDDWFNGGDKILERNLPEGVSLESAQAIFDNPNCGACDPEIKAKLEAIKNKNESLKK